jgi:uncharacterized membrane protein YeiH
MEVLFIWVEYIGTFVFAVTGATIAAKADYDFFGMLFLAFLTGTGGGTLRDIILDQPVFWTLTPTLIYIIIVAAFLCLFFQKTFNKLTKTLFVFVTLGLGLFAVMGTQKSLGLGHNVITALIMGVITGVLGGVLRSVFSKEEPIIFKKEIYATSAFLASICFIVLNNFDVNNFLNTAISIVVCLFVRIWSVKYHIHLPMAR